MRTVMLSKDDFTDHATKDLEIWAEMTERYEDAAEVEVQVVTVYNSKGERAKLLPR